MCPWCRVSPGEIEQAKVEVLESFSVLANHGFHCVLHAESFHQLLKLDKNMHFSCCDHDVLGAEKLAELTAMMDSMTLKED